jgi:hypothetical protein
VTAQTITTGLRRLAGRQIVLPALRFVNSQTAAGADRLGVV